MSRLSYSSGMAHIVGVLIFAAVGSGCLADSTTSPSTAPAVPAVDPQVYSIHRPTGFAFPNTLDGYVFVEQRQYNREGTHVSFGWNTRDFANRPMAATVYLCPAPNLVSGGSPQETADQAKARLFDQLWQQQVQSILGAHAPATSLPPETILISYAGRTYTGRRQIFHYKQTFSFRPQQVASCLYLFPFINDKWMLKYRFTYPATENQEAAIFRFIGQVPANNTLLALPNP